MERWWVIEEAALLSALRAAGSGEDPDVVLMELLANSSTEKVDGDD